MATCSECKQPLQHKAHKLDCSMGRAASKAPKFTPDERLRIPDPIKRKRVLEITCQMLEGAALRGELDVNDVDALKKAVMECGRAAFLAYNAAEEFLS